MITIDEIIADYVVGDSRLPLYPLSAVTIASHLRRITGEEITCRQLVEKFERAGYHAYRADGSILGVPSENLSSHEPSKGLTSKKPSLQDLSSQSLDNQDAQYQELIDYSKIFFRLAFLRDEQTAALFDPLDERLTTSPWLRRIIKNAKHNPQSRLRHICRYVCQQKEMMNRDVHDADVEEFLLWLTQHTPSSKSALAAQLLFLLDNTHYDRLSADQKQFIRESNFQLID